MTTLITAEGNSNDLLNIDEALGMKMTRLFHFNPISSEAEEEVLDIAVTSTNPHGQHPLFDQMLDKRLRITIEVE